MKRISLLLGGISAVHADGGRKLAAGGGTYDHYANAEGIPNLQPPVNGIPQEAKWADPTNLQWALGDTMGGLTDATTPAPHASFGHYNCRGYFQSPIDIPKKAIFHQLRLNGDPTVPTPGASRGIVKTIFDGTGAAKGDKQDSIYDSYQFGVNVITQASPVGFVAADQVGGGTFSKEEQGDRAVPTTDGSLAAPPTDAGGQIAGLTRSQTADGVAKMYVGLVGTTEALNEKFKLFLGPKQERGNSGSGPAARAKWGDATDPVVVYQPLQFHWHFPSEHTIDGIGYPGELHIVHSRLKWFRDTTHVHVNKGAGMFPTVLDFKNSKDACSEGATTNGKKDSKLNANGGNALATDATFVHQSANGAVLAGTAGTDAFPDASMDNVACATANCGCSTVLKNKYMPFLVLGFFLTEKCNMAASNLDADTLWASRHQHKIYNAPVGGNNPAPNYGTALGTGLTSDRVEASCRSEDVDTDRSVTDKLYNPGFLSKFQSDAGTLNVGGSINNAGLASDNAGKPIGTTTGKFIFEANFGEAMKGAYFRYQGGLTTPPCTEGVEWVVFERPLLLNTGTIAYYLKTAGIVGLTGIADMTTNADIEELIKATPTHIRNNRPTVALHGRNIQYSKLLAIENDKTNGARYNYKRPDMMWSKNWADGAAADGDSDALLRGVKPTGSGVSAEVMTYPQPPGAAGLHGLTGAWDATKEAGTDIAAAQMQWAGKSQCQNAVDHPSHNFQAPINFVGGEVYRGVTPVNRSWLKSNTFGYVGGQTGSAARWVLKNTGHGFNVIPRFSYNGQDPFVRKAPSTPGAESNIGHHTHFTDGLDHTTGAAYRNLAGGSANTIPAGYFVKKMNALGTHVDWYPLIQFHFHFPSEHTVDGYQYAGEMHLVHHKTLSATANQWNIGNHYIGEFGANITAAGGPTLIPAAPTTRRLVSEEKVNGEDAVVLDLTGVQTRQLASGGGGSPSYSTNSQAVKPTGTAKDGSWADAVVLGFFLEEDSSMTPPTDSIMGLFGFNRDTGVPYAQGSYWAMDVDSKKFASALFGDMGTKGFEVKPSTGEAAASQLSTATNAVDANLKAPYTRNYFNYMGGLTTPPCSEGVQFIIFTDPLKVASSEAKLFRQNFFMNNRPTQPRGNRKVLFNDMANAAQALSGNNAMTSVNPFAAPKKPDNTITTTFLTTSTSSESSGAVSTALNMFAAAAASVFALVLYM